MRPTSELSSRATKQSRFAYHCCILHLDPRSVVIASNRFAVDDQFPCASLLVDLTIIFLRRVGETYPCRSAPLVRRGQPNLPPRSRMRSLSMGSLIAQSGRPGKRTFGIVQMGRVIPPKGCQESDTYSQLTAFALTRAPS
jgi:hypothetical protein